MAEIDPTTARWFKSSLSGSGNESSCVEVAHLANGRTAVRDSKDPTGPTLIFTREEWRAFLGGARLGDFDR